MATYQDVFEACIATVKLRRLGGATTLSNAKTVFECMARRLSTTGATDVERRAFLVSIVTAINSEPGFAGEQHAKDKADLLSILEGAFGDFPVSVDPARAVKLNFLDRVRF